MVPPYRRRDSRCSLGFLDGTIHAIRSTGEGGAVCWPRGVIEVASNRKLHEPRKAGIARLAELIMGFRSHFSFNTQRGPGPGRLCIARKGVWHHHQKKTFTFSVRKLELPDSCHFGLLPTSLEAGEDNWKSGNW